MTDIISKLQGYLTSQDELSLGEKVIRETDLDFLADSLSEVITHNHWKKTTEHPMPVDVDLIGQDEYGTNWIVKLSSKSRVLDPLLSSIVKWKPID